jgi:hypothetical protein
VALSRGVAAAAGAAAKSVEAAWLTALRRLASHAGDALELHTNMCSSLFELEFEPPSSFFLYCSNQKSTQDSTQKVQAQTKGMQVI